MANSFIERSSADNNVKMKSNRASRACERCRLRKIKCDGNLAGCNKCLTKKLECTYKDKSAAFQPNLTSRLKFFTPEIENTEITRRKFSYSTKLNSYPLYQSLSEPSVPFNLLELKHQLSEASSSKQFKIVPYSHGAHSKKLITKSRTAPNSSINYLDFNMMKLASKTAHAGLNKYELLTLYPNGRFEVQGFSPIGYMFTNASFLECLTNGTQGSGIFNANLARSSSFNLPIINSPTLRHRLNLSWQILVKTLCMEYFKRIHLSYPLLDPEHFLKLLDEYRSGMVNINEGSWPYFGFLVTVLCLVTVSIVPSLSQYHELFELETKKSIQKYYKIPHTYICQALFLLRTFPKLKDKNSKWIRINHVAIRMSIGLGCMTELPSSKNIANNQAVKLMNLRIGLIAHFIDLAVISAINSSPQLSEEMFTNPFFTLPLNHPYLHQECQLDNQRPCKFNTDEYFPQCKHHDFVTLRLLIEIARVFYTITKFNNSIIIHSMNNPNYIGEKLVESIGLEKMIVNIFKNMPAEFNTILREFKLIEVFSKFRSIGCLIERNILITELPKKSQKFTTYIHLWLNFNLTSIWEKLSKFELIWSPTNNEEDLIREYCAKRCLLSVIKLSQLIWVIGDHFNSYLLNNKYLMISKACLILSRVLIAYNAESTKHGARPIRSVQIHQNRNFDYPFSGLQDSFISLEEPLMMANNFNINNLITILEFLISVVYYYSKDLPLSKEVLLTLREYLKQNDIEIKL